MNLNEPELAIEDFEKVLQINPNNAAAIKNIRQCKELRKTLCTTQKKIYSTMIDKMIKLPVSNDVYSK